MSLSGGESPQRNKEQNNDIKRKEKTTMDKVEYFVSQWGCEQTNVTFYKVIKRTPKMVTVIEVGSKKVATSWGHYMALPSDESSHRGKEMRKKVKNYSFSKEKSQDFIDINSFSSAYRWDGEPVEGTNYA